MFTSSSLLESLSKHRLLDPAPLDEARQLATRISDPRPFADELIRRGWLTKFQIRMLSQGHGPQLILGPYIILEKLGEGGMGAVYKARNTRLGRVVAIKLLRKEHGTRAEVIRRFRREVQVVSALSHPNVVRAIDALEVDGNLIFEMEYVEGVNLSQLVHKRGPLPVPMACDFIRQASLGLQHAHEKNLVHRDIKPSNLVVTRALAPAPGVETSPHGLIKVLDMGLALMNTPEGEDEKTRLTQLGKVVGTTDFLAPEQARNSHGVDIRADLYSLGCTFYFLLTGKVPFPDGPPMEKLLKHQLDEPQPVEELRPEVPPALVAVVRKLMAKKVENRYQTPGEVAVVLEPFTRSGSRATPVPPTLPSPAPIPVAAKASSAPAIPVLPASKLPSAPAMPTVAPAAIAVLSPTELPAARPQAAIMQTSEVDPTDSDTDPFLAMPSRPSVQRPSRKRAVLFTLVGLLVATGLGAAGWYALRRDSRSSESSPDPDAEKQPAPNEPKPWSLDRLAADHIPKAERVPGQPPGLVAVLGEHALRHWNAVACIAYHPDGKLIATGSFDGFIRLWNAETGKEEAALPVRDVSQVQALAFRSDGTLVSVHLDAGRAFAIVWDIKKQTFRAPQGLSSHTVLAAALSPNAQLVALVEAATDDKESFGVLSLVKVNDGEVKDTFPADKALLKVSRMAWSSDGKTLAIAQEPVAPATSPARLIRIFDTAMVKELTPLPGHDVPIRALAFAPGGKVLASAGFGPRPGGGGQLSEVKLWEMPGGKLTATYPVVPSLALAFGPGGKVLAWGGGTRASDGRLVIRNPAEPQHRFALGPLDYPVTALVFSPDGKTLASGGGDQTLRLWNAESGKEVTLRPPFRGAATSAVLSPDGQMLAAVFGQPDQSAVLYDLAAGKEYVLKGVKGVGQTLGFVEGGKTLAAWRTTEVVYWKAATGEELPPFKAPPDSVLLGPVAPDGHSVVVVGSKDGVVKLWDPVAIKERVVLKEQAKGTNGVAAFSPDGKLLALGGLGQANVRLYDVATGEPKETFKGIAAQVFALAFSADGSMVAALGRDGSGRIWETATYKERGRWAPRAPSPEKVMFSSDGAFLAAWGHSSLAFVNLSNGKETKVVQASEVLMRAAAFSPTGQTLVTANTSGRLLLLNPANPEVENAPKIDIPGPVYGLTYSADGRYLVTANGNGTLYVLRVDAAAK